MAIALPPPIEPQLASVAELKTGANTHVGIGNLRFEIADHCELGPDRIREIAKSATTASDIVRGLGNTCYALGWPAERTRYAVENQTIYVSVERGRVAAISVPVAYRPYFEDLPKRKPLRQRDLEGARALADAQSERGGDNYQLRLDPSGKDAAALVMVGPTPGRAQAQAAAGFTTSGNRYSGRYLADLTLRGSLASGTELTVSGVVGVRPPALRGSLNGPYHEVGAVLSQVSSVGVFNFDGRYVDFAPRAQAVFPDGSLTDVELTGHSREGGLSWVGSLYADYNSRVSMTVRAGYTDQNLRYQSSQLLSERYWKVDVSLGSVNRFVVGPSDVFELTTNVSLGRGLAGNDFPLGDPAHGDYVVARPSVRLAYGPAALFTPIVEVNAQFASATLPQPEQWVLGGPGGLRVYEAGTASGDTGYLGRFSIQQKRIGIGPLTLRPTLFFEYGTAKFRDGGSFYPSGTARRSDVGLELALQLGSHIDLTGYAAQPLVRVGPAPIADDLQRVGARLVVRF